MALFRKNIEPRCAYCTKGSAISEREVICQRKGIVAAEDGSWIHFDFVPGELNLRTGSAAVTGKLCVIGAELNESAVAELFGV